MILADKIIELRKKNGWSQEELAEKVGVSRQSVSKWEMDQSLPHIDKVLLICELFSVSADELLHNDVVIHRDTSVSSASEDGGAPRGNKYLGTDGIYPKLQGALSARSRRRRFLDSRQPSRRKAL